MAKVPDKLVDEVALVGSAERITDQLERWKGTTVSEMLISSNQKAALRVLAEAVL